MPAASGYLIVAIAVVAWTAYNALAWWMGYEEQVRPRWGTHARIERPPAWVLCLCGVRGRVRTLNLPMALAQVSALAGVLLLLLAMAYYMLVLRTAPFRNLRGDHFLMMTLVAPLIPYLVAEAVMWAWRRRRTR